MDNKKQDIAITPDLKDIKFDSLETMGLTEKANRHIKNFILNQEPVKSWVKKHPVYGNQYLPIDKVEYLLTVLFGQWRVEVKEVKMIANSMQCTIRLYYWDSYTNEYNWQDGVGASPMQQDSGGGKLKPNGVMLATPIAKTNAIKDAADTIGRLFGRDLNRKNLTSYSGEGEKFKDLSIEAYHYEKPYIDYISSTGLKYAANSLKAFKHYQDSKAEQERKIHFDFGNAFELAKLAPKEFIKKVAIFKDSQIYNTALAVKSELKNVRNSKYYKDQKEAFEVEASEREQYIILDKGDHSTETIQKMLISCDSDATIKALLSKVEYQYSFFWEDSETGLKLKARPDVSIVNKKNLIDIKTCDDASPKAVSKAVSNFNYPMQACMQIDGVQQSGYIDEVDNYFWLFVEKKAPFDAVLYEFSKEDRAIKMAEYKRTIKSVARAIKTNDFPGYRGESSNEFGILTAKIW